jgi:hypothetical protein
MLPMVLMVYLEFAADADAPPGTQVAPGTVQRLRKCAMTVPHVQPMLALQTCSGNSCGGSAGRDDLQGGALQLVGALGDRDLQNAHARASKIKSPIAQRLLAELKRKFDAQSKFTGKV